MLLQVHISAEWAGVLVVLFLAVIGWAWSMQSQINTIRTELAVNTAKDEAIKGSITEMKEDIHSMKKDIEIIRDFMAAQKAINGHK